MPDERVVSSIANPLVKRARRLKTRKGREDEDAFLVEGIRSVWSAVDGRAHVQHFIVAPDLLTSDSARALIDEQERTGAAVARVTADVFASFSSRDNPVGLAAIVKRDTARLEDLAVEDDSLYIALDEVHGPGNLGTVIRTADAVSAGVILLGDATDPFHPGAVKASMGALFHVPLARASSAAELFAWAEERSATVAATSARRGRDHWSSKYETPLILLFGSEAHGLPDDVVERAAFALRIPMLGRSSSLNLAAAVAVIAYEAVGARRGRPPLA